MLIINHKV